MSTLVILRGNSRSGKTTTAKLIQDSFPRGKVMVISQDEIRLRMLNVKDRKENPTASLIKHIAEFGKGCADIVLIEGILGNKIYREIFLELSKFFDENVLIYYYDIPFEETLNRHSNSEKSNLFGKDRIKSWWLDKDYLGLPGEVLLTSELKQEDVVSLIVNDLTHR